METYVVPEETSAELVDEFSGPVEIIKDVSDDDKSESEPSNEEEAGELQPSAPLKTIYAGDNVSQVIDVMPSKKKKPRKTKKKKK